MNGFDHMAQALQVALFLLGVLVAFGLARLFVAWARGPVKSQRERESDFLVRTAMSMPIRREAGRWVRDDWRESFTGSIDEFKTRDAA